MECKLEICIDSVDSARIAAEDRIELCANLFEGGTTPPASIIEECRKVQGIELMVMVRPRGGDFLYSDTEFQLMKKDIENIKALGADGVVFGLLDKEGNIDISRTKELVDIARPMQVTFHRAFDMSRDIFQALEDVIETGCDRILTSGGEQTAPLGMIIFVNNPTCCFPLVYNIPKPQALFFSYWQCGFRLMGGLIETRASFCFPF